MKKIWIRNGKKLENLIKKWIIFYKKMKIVQKNMKKSEKNIIKGIKYIGNSLNKIKIEKGSLNK